MLTGFDPNQIKDLDGARQAIGLLLNLVEELKSENDALREEVQKLRDEINRLQGEQGKPSIKPGKKQPKQDHSSEKERRRPKKWRKGSKVDKVKIDREETLSLDQNHLPADAEFKGYEAVVVQDIQVKTDNVRFNTIQPQSDKYIWPRCRPVIKVNLGQACGRWLSPYIMGQR